MLPLDDTIVAIASAPAGAARGIVRLSGPNAVDQIARVFQSEPVADLSAVRKATRLEGSVAIGQRKLVASLCLWPTSRSYTRQPVAEIHTIGSPPLLEVIVQSLCGVGARLAQPGEFTMRAFLAGRLDLTQAEAVLGVIDAADRRQLQTALAQLAGGFSQPLLQLRSGLLDLLADLEAGLDFTEEDIRFVSTDELENRVSSAAAELERLSAQLGTRSVAGRLPRVVLAGPPNVGKSSLFNSLIGASAAIVSPQAGTTRDYLTATIDIDGIQVELVDTAGVSQSGELTGDRINEVAEQIAVTQRDVADLLLLCRENGDAATEIEGERAIHVVTKADSCNASCDSTKAAQEIQTSSKTGRGIAELRMAIRQQLESQRGSAEVIPATAVRVRESLHRAAATLAQIRQLVVDGSGEELIAAELRVALAELGNVVGAVYTDDLLDRIFSRFCIGK
jgi:tRNA modification GTPase